MNAGRPLPRRLDATDDDLALARETARAIALTTLGRDPGPMKTAASMSHYVCIAADVVVKLIDVTVHDRLELETVLAAHLPAGLGAPLLACGRHSLDTCEVRYACFTRMPGAPPGVGLPGADTTTVCSWADQAVCRLNDLHTWTPPAAPARALLQSPVHEGFTGRVALLAEIEGLLAADRDSVVSRRLTDGLAVIGRNAPPGAAADVPVHADCDWDNWLTDDQNVTALLDFERARFGDPADDWVLLAATSGPHTALILDAIVERTAASPEALRNACEVRDATLIAQDLRHALAHPHPPMWMRQRIADLEELVIGRRWWRPARSR